MKSCLLSAVFFCIVYQAMSQQKTLHIPMEGKDTLYHYQLIMKDCIRLSVTPLRQSAYPYHFRLWAAGQMTEIWKTSAGDIKGNVLFWADSCSDKRKAVPFEQSYALDSCEAPGVYELIKNMHIADIPHQASIPTWSSGLDAPYYMIEYEEENDYYFKSYWYPAGFRKIKEAVILDRFIKQMSVLDNTLSKADSFSQVMPDKYSMSHSGALGVRIITAPARHH